IELMLVRGALSDGESAAFTVFGRAPVDESALRAFDTGHDFSFSDAGGFEERGKKENLDGAGSARWFGTTGPP
ncbi:MAG TPA: hypothetical protein VK475_04085, partial [Pyrinomonadaceae bacterium]|nr:hypothetical protein [Pyrinomonadaceae bacterium]